jgi:hypothetical protein
MKRKIKEDLFNDTYSSIVQILFKLADPTFMYGELGRGSGKTTHIMAPRLDRIQNSMPGSCLVLGASTYKAIFDNILSAMMEYFSDTYERGIYYEIGKRPPRHFKECATYIHDYKHTISFHNGTVVQFVSADRPESMLGKNAAHLFIDEMLKIPKEKFLERIIPALRADRAKFGNSPYFMGITGFSSTPNFETDEDWFLEYEKNMNPDLLKCIVEIAYELDLRIAELQVAQREYNDKKIKKLETFVNRWQERLNDFRRGQTFYFRASSFSNIKILGIDYIQNQIKSISDEDMLNTSILAVRKTKVKNLFFGKFGKRNIFDDSYIYTYIDNYTADGAIENTARNLKYYDSNAPLILGYDPGPFTSIIAAQSKPKELRVLKNFWAIHPDQQPEIAKDVADFFKYHHPVHKRIFLYYDRAANQTNPKYREFYEQTADFNDTDALILKSELEKYGWSVTLMSLGWGTVRYFQLYRLLNILFSSPAEKHDKILIDKNECEELISSIYNSPVKKTDGRIKLDKSSEKKLEYNDQILYSTQLSSAFMYMLWGMYKKYLPASENKEIVPSGGGTYMM